MDISTVQPRQGVYHSYFTKQNSNKFIESPFNHTAKSDTVHISEKAKELSQKIQTERIATRQLDTATEISYDDLPPEAFALPEWFSEWIPTEAMVDSEVGLSLSAPRQARNNSLSGGSMAELGEYLDTMLKYFQEELKNNGIENNADYYKFILQDQKRSEDVHQSMKKRLADDPRVMDLMHSFGINL